MIVSVLTGAVKCIEDMITNRPTAETVLGEEVKNKL